MSGKTFIDTNILVYAYDQDAGSKHHIAKQIIEDLWESQSGALSTQVLQEFYNCVTRKISRRLTKDEARLIVNTYSVWAVTNAYAEMLNAFQIEDEAQVNFWDALILSSAAKAGASRLLSEDLNAGQRIAGVRVENPFRSASHSRV